MESTASSPRGAKRSRTRRSSDEEGGTLCEVKLEETFVVPNLLIQAQKNISIPKAVGTFQLLGGFRVLLPRFLTGGLSVK